MHAPRELAALLDEFDLDRAGVEELYHHTKRLVDDEVASVADLAAAGEDVIPVFDHDDLAAMADPADERRQVLRGRGCVVVRGTFDVGEATAWNDELGDYLASNDYFTRLADRDPSRAASGSGITPVYWSRPQIAARQHPRMVEVRRFLNSLWTTSDPDQGWFDPDHDIAYADRVRWRAPGAVARGLDLHCDSPATDGWRNAENHRTFRQVLAGRPELHDPWDAAHRTTYSGEVHGAADVFRTFQGWTALTEVEPTDGVLQIVPIPLATAALVVRGIGMELGLFGDPREAPRRMEGSGSLRPAAIRIPAMRPGDTVWWHGDLMHGVEPAANDTRWSNVMYIGASPRCERNDAHNALMRGWFEAGDSPAGFPPEDYERDFADRATVDDLNAVGRQQFGYDPVPTS
jgi:hypothetical protein